MTNRPNFRLASRGDDGIAMVLSLLFMLLLSALGTAILVLSRSETLSSVNYRMMSQARFGAESGVHKAAHWILNSYTLPGTGSDPLSNFNMTVSPVTYSGTPVVLSSFSDVTANYPLASVQTAFNTASQGGLAVGDGTVLYTSSATLLSMRTVIPYGSSTPFVVQTWRLTGRGSIQGVRAAEAEVSAVLERKVVPTFTYGLFASDPMCNSLEFTGSSFTDSYDSSNITWVSGLPQTTNSGGHVGTNGNLTVGGGTNLYGTLSTPRTGVGNCAQGAVTAVDSNGNANIQGGVIKLPQAVSFPTPEALSPLPPTTQVTLSGAFACADVPISSGSCYLTYPTAGTGLVTLDPMGTQMALPNVHLTSGAILVLNAGTYNINSLVLNSNSKLRVGTGPVIVHLAGQGVSAPADLEGGQLVNTSFVPSNLRIIYGGLGTLKLTAGSATAASVYAPKGLAQVTGGAQFYGAIIANRIFFGGGADLHRDRKLEEFFTVGPQMMSVFTWKEY